MSKIRYFGLLVVALLLGVSGAMAQNAILTGQVTEMFDGQKEPILGANVAVVNKGNRVLGGGVTDMDGNFSIAVPKNEKDLKIRFSYIGMKTQDIAYTGQQTLNVTLSSDAELLQDVEITAKNVMLWVFRSLNRRLLPKR